MQTDTFGAYVSARLEEWGREFALHRDCEYLGHQSQNMLQVLIDHKGEMPARPTGFKPLEVSQPAHMIELIVSRIAREQVDIACVLRAYYCGSGRKKVERYETALLLIANAHRDEQGRQARRAGRKADANPYRIGSNSSQHYAWAKGHQEECQRMKGRR